MRDQLKILTSVWFILSIGVLIANDFLLKEWYGNWMTGKLSDFAGILAFGLFGLAMFPRSRTISLWLIGGLFVYWKSSYSQPLIDAWNSLAIYTLNRVVDYTDLIALSMLPVAHFIYKEKDKINYLKISPILPLLIAVFAFCATSYQNELDLHERYDFAFSKEELIRRVNVIRKETGQVIVSPLIENANDFMVFTLEGGVQDTVGYFFSTERQLLDTFRNINQGIDSVRTRNALVRDSIYLNQMGGFTHHITCHQAEKDYFYTIEVEIRLEGDKAKSALILTKAILYNLELNEEEDKEEYLTQEFEKAFIEKIRKLNN